MIVAYTPTRICLLLLNSKTCLLAVFVRGLKLLYKRKRIVPADKTVHQILMLIMRAANKLIIVSWRVLVGSDQIMWTGSFYTKTLNIRINPPTFVMYLFSADRLIIVYWNNYAPSPFKTDESICKNIRILVMGDAL